MPRFGTRGTKDMSYALAEKVDRIFGTWAERNPGYGSGAVEAANEVLRESRGLSNNPHMATIADINAQLANIRKVKDEVKGKEGGDDAYEKAVDQEKDLMARKEKVKNDMIFEQKKAEVEKNRNLSELELRKKEKSERRERAFALNADRIAAANAAAAAAAATTAATAKRPTSVTKKMVAAKQKRKTLIEKVLAKNSKLLKN